MGRESALRGAQAHGLELETGNPEAHFECEAAASLSDLAEISASVHCSLLLGEILQNCLRVLRHHLPVRRLSLVQHRANENTATLCRIDEHEGWKPISPAVIALDDSRLKTCLTHKQGAEIITSSETAPDTMELAYLLPTDASSVLYAVLLLGEKLEGVLAIAHSQEFPIGPSQREWLDFLTSQLALAVENSNAHYYERRQGRQLQLLGEIAKQVVMLEDISEFLQDASDRIRRSFHYDLVEIWATGNRQELTLRGFACKPAQGVIIGETLPPMVEECRLRNGIICRNEVSGEGKKTTSRPDTLSQLAVPIRVRGKFLGVLSIECSRLDAFPAEDHGVMEAVASLIASAFDNLRARTHAQQSNEYMQAILESAKERAILSTDLNGYVITGSTGAQKIFGLTQQEILGRDILTLFSDRRFQRELALYISGSARTTLERNRLSQAVGEENCLLDVIIQRVHDVESRSIGFLCIAKDITEHVKLEQTLEKLSYTDELTGLYNQRRFLTAIAEEIERSLRSGGNLSLCFFDLDGFKRFNDTHGHPRGDQALKETADLLGQLVRNSVDSCYRYGGDEFTIIMPGTARQDALIVAERVRKALSDHFDAQITASIGIAEHTGTMDAEEFVSKADGAMYAAKGKGGNCIVLG